jgi:hypothetical protein
MQPMDPLKKLIAALEAENEKLLNDLKAQDARFEAMEGSLVRLIDLYKRQDERLSTLEQLCETLSNAK